MRKYYKKLLNDYTKLLSGKCSKQDIDVHTFYGFFNLCMIISFQKIKPDKQN